MNKFYWVLVWSWGRNTYLDATGCYSYHEIDNVTTLDAEPVAEFATRQEALEFAGWLNEQVNS